MNPCGLEPRLTAFKRSRSMIAASAYEPTPPIGKQHYYIGALWIAPPGPASARSLLREREMHAR